MDIFNKKKLIKLEQKNAILQQEKITLTNEIETLRDVLKNSNCSSLLLEENKKLIDWIEKILSEFGTMKVYDRRPVSIPVYKEFCYSSTSEKSQTIKKTTIVIPEIVIQKSEMI